MFLNDDLRKQACFLFCHDVTEFIRRILIIVCIHFPLEFGCLLLLHVVTPS